jgi:hypothetical protein
MSTIETASPEDFPRAELPRELPSPRTDLTKTVAWPSEGLVYDLWPACCKIFELDIKNNSQTDCQLSLAAVANEGPHLLFSTDRRAPFVESLSIFLDKEGKNKLFIQIATELVHKEVQYQRALLLTEEHTNSQLEIPVIIKVTAPHSDFPSQN